MILTIDFTDETNEVTRSAYGISRKTFTACGSS